MNTCSWCGEEHHGSDLMVTPDPESYCSWECAEAECAELTFKDQQ